MVTTSSTKCRCLCHDEDVFPDDMWGMCPKCMDNEAHLPSDLKEPTT